MPRAADDFATIGTRQREIEAEESKSRESAAEPDAENIRGNAADDGAAIRSRLSEIQRERQAARAAAEAQAEGEQEKAEGPRAVGWYLIYAGERCGPFENFGTAEEMAVLVRRGVITIADIRRALRGRP